MFDPVELPAAYGLVMDRIERAIHLGVYAPGDRLPAERELSENLGVSRVTVREAMRTLQGRGYLRSRRGAKGGWFVVAPHTSASALRHHLQDSLEELNDLLDFRVAIEGAAARLAATRHHEDEMARMRQAVEAMRQSENIAGFRRSDSEFHLVVALAAHSRMLRDTIEEARSRLFVMIDAIGFEVILHTSLHGHECILAAIDAGNASAAEQAAVEHVETTRSELYDLLRNGEEGR